MSLLSAFADTATVNGIKWKYTVSNGRVSIGGGNSSSTAVPKSTSGEITIPSTLGGKPVTSIGDYAFEECSSLTSVTIPDGVTSIGYSAFRHCSGLTSVTIGNDVTSIGGYAFAYCSSLTSVTIPDGVTSIGHTAFYACSGLTSVTIPDGVTSIGSDAFLATPFYNNQPDGLVVFGKVAYRTKGTCPSDVTIPDGVTSISDCAFAYCSSLMSVTIPDSVTSIGYSAFSGCNGLTNVTIPDGVTNIGHSAFYGCSGLTSVVIPNGVTNILNQTFSNCSGLTSVTIPDGVTSIRGYAFSNCSGLTSVTIPDGVTSIEDCAFSGCSGLVAFYVGAQNANYKVVNDIMLLTKDGKTLVAMLGGLTSVTIHDGVTSIGGYAFSGCRSLTSVTIPNSVTNIGNYAFSGCRGLTNITIPDSVTSIGYDAFSGCSGLTSVTIPNSVTNIGHDAFAFCSSLMSVMIPGSVTSIGDYAFRNCSGLTSVTVSDGVTSIGHYAFYDCSGLASIVFEGNALTVGSTVFGGVNGGCIAYVRRSSTGWGVPIPGIWNGLAIRYYDAKVTFDMSGHGTRTGGGELVQAIEDRAAAVVPEVAADEGWEFLGWDADFSCVTSNMTVNALWRRVYASGEALGADATSASLPWSVGTNGMAAAKGSDDATAARGKSVKFTAADDASSWVEVLVTNACRVSFDWKSSCEPLLKGSPYDYLSFAVDGEQQNFVCGETDWTNVTFYVTGEGEHHLRWTFLRDEDGSSGEDCAWLANVSVAQFVAVVFDGGGATAGSVPGPVTAYSDESIVLPGQGTLSWLKHTFLGWSDGVTLYYPGDPYPCNGTLLLTAMWQEDEPQTFGEYLNWSEQTFTTGGDAEWTRTKGVSADGYSLRSGGITHNQTSRLETVVSGAGTIRFSCKVDGEIVKRIVYDGLAFCIDGAQQGNLMGDADWTEKTFEVTGSGSHTLAWLYVRDEDGTGGGEDCAWLDCVTWTPSGVTVDVGGKSVTVPTDWLTNITERIEAAGGDAVAALQATAANGRLSNVECYVFGLDPEDVTNDLKIVSFPMKADGTPDLENIAVDPPKAQWNVQGARAVVYGAATLDGEWKSVEGATAAEKAAMRFFKVEVEVQ